MKKISKTLLISLALLTSLTLQAQNKPKTETAPAALANLQSQLPMVSYDGTDKVNYVRTFDLYAPLSSFPTGSTLTNAINAGNIMQATQYMDGLSRPIQTVSRQGSGNHTDIVSFVVYDQYGRPSLQPMPYVASSTSGGMQTQPSADQTAFLNAHYTGEDVFYTKTEFENSPLNRPLKQMAPGNSWVGSGVGVSSEYRSNTTADGVRIWTMGTTPATAAVYQDGELSVMATTDENGNQVKEYTNGQGQVVLKKVQKTGTGYGHGDWLNTYYVYDIYNNLRSVIPPRAVELLNSNGWNWGNANKLVFSYDYDHRNRMVTKQVPGAERVDMVYDKLDRVVLTQDANQRAFNQWAFIKYDELNRPVLTGFVTYSQNRPSLQAIADSWTGELHVKREGLSTASVLEGVSITTSVRDTDVDIYRHKNTGYVDYLPGFVSVTDDDFVTETVSSLSHEYTVYEGYHDATFPLLADNTITFEMNTVNFYDDYDFSTKYWDDEFVGKGFYPDEDSHNAVTPVQDLNVKGMATGSKVRILDTDDFLTTLMFYDNRGRVIQTQGENHLSGTDISTTQYDFAGRVLNTYTVHNNPQASSNSTTKILKRFSYDDTGRLISIEEKLNDAGSLKTLVTNSYNALGELVTKSLGDAINSLETLDYDYNIRGWLKSINGGYVADPNDPNENHHFFGMDLSYDYGFEKNQLNGNIAGIKWRSKSSTKQRAYGFEYDKVNRLKKADYNQLDAPNNWAKTLSDFSTNYGYDANGNILNLQREGVVAGTITTIDKLTYDYGSGFNMASAGNQLFSVKDTEGDLGQGDFKDGNTSGSDYSYDANGNMKDDLNKGVTNITYNHLNLATTVSFGNDKSITYAYDAAGIKLKKTVEEQRETGVEVLEFSEFSSGLDGWSGYRASAQHGLSHAGESNVLKVIANSTNNLHRLQKVIVDPGTQKIRVKAKVYLPSTNTQVDGVQVQVGISSSDRSPIFTTTDQWIEIAFTTAGEPNSVFTSFRMTVNGSDTFIGSNNDYFFVKDIEVAAITGTIGTENLSTVTDYAGGFIYENDALQHFAHEEGRVRKNKSGDLVYDYFIKDHLGNTRMTLTEEQETTTYKATMEVGTNTSGEVVDTYEESVFLYVDQVRDNTNTTANTTDVPGINDEYTARLNGDETGRTVGPAKMMVVNPGDQVNVSVDYYHGGTYVDNGAQLKTNMIAAIAGLFGGASTGSIQEVAVFDQFDNQYASAAAYVGTRGDAAKPRAYLNVVVFDKDFNLVSTGSAFKQTQSASGYDSLSHNITLAQGGYVYVYLSNESQTDFDVHFDNLEIAHTNGTILQEDHYYPFGLSINALSSSAPLSKPNNFKYNGFEEQTDFDLGWYDYQARNYDPQLGRFTSVDPAADAMRRHSPYNYAFDNPIRFIDPDGMMPEDQVGGGSGGSPFDNRSSGCKFGDCGSDSSFDPSQGLREAGNGGGTDPLRNPLKIDLLAGSTYSGPSLDELLYKGNFIQGVGAGISAGASGTWSFVKSLGTGQGWRNLGNGLANFGTQVWTQLGNTRGSSGYDFGEGFGSLPSMPTTSYGWGYGIGYGIEKGAELAVGGALYGTVKSSLMASRMSNRAFWAGSGSRAAAESKGFQTIGQTRAGRNLEVLTAGMPYHPGSQSWAMWSRLSTTYAKGIPKGSSVSVFLRNPRPGGIWFTVEKPILLKRGINIIYK